MCEKSLPDPPATETNEGQREFQQRAMASNNQRPTAHHRQSSSLPSLASPDDNNFPTNDGEPYRESTSSQANAQSRAPYKPYTSGPDIPKSQAQSDDQSVTGPIHLPICMQLDEIRSLLHDASTVPPVTPETLKELDLQWIQNNINLRVDVHYDYDLHFMPISGQRGEEKRLDAQKYWRALEWEFRIYQHNSSGPCSICFRSSAGPTNFLFNQRLPIMFRKLKALLLILVPTDDHSRVSDTLDIPLLMQEVQNGALDIQGLSRWLSELLTTHCAPIRDDWAQDMRDKISEGAHMGDMASLIAGLEKLFSFCEAMKLDVANHQIRTFRLPLIEDGVSFQRDYFQTRIRLGKLNPTSSMEWFTSMHKHCLVNSALETEYSPLIYGLISLVTSPTTRVPEFFKYDHNRIQQLREEVSDLIHLDICWDFLNQKINHQFDSALCRKLKTRLLDLTDGESSYEAGSNAIWDAHLDSISLEVTRVASEVLRPSNDMITSGTVAKVQDQLDKLFYTEPGTRLVNLAAELQMRVSCHVRSFLKLSSLQISELQQQHQQWHQTGSPGRPIPEFENIARRLAHIAVIHWRVWRDLYLSAMMVWREEGLERQN